MELVGAEKGVTPPTISATPMTRHRVVTGSSSP
jgi:hypothetical protein